jgi:GT2 family glycosyltransferase/glycosyltransferase involved in cell wall biosynthesis
MNRPPLVNSSLGDLGGSGLQRVLWPLVALNINGYIHLKMPNTMHFVDLNTLSALKPDTILFHRSHTKEQIRYIQDCRDNFDTTLVYTIDDWVGQVPDYSPHKKELSFNVDKAIKKSIKLVDRLIVTNKLLANVYGHNTDTYIIPSYLPEFIWKQIYAAPKASAKYTKPRIGWSGGIGHGGVNGDGDLEILNGIADALGDKVTWVFLGMVPEKFKGKENVEVHEPVAAQNHPMALYQLNLDIALAPLLPNEFNKAKSINKILEYAACGYYTIASDIEPYKGSACPLLPYKVDAWVAEIEKCLSDLDGTRQKGQDLSNWVWENYKLEDHLEEYAKVLSPDKIPFIPKLENCFEPKEEIVDIVITTYNNQHVTEPCIESILECKDDNKTKFEIVIVDDCSTDPKFICYLGSLQNKGQANVTFLKKNVGNIIASNTGFMIHPDRDIIWLNSDTIVHGDWIDRLLKVAYSKKYASVCPLTNAGALLSYPSSNECKLDLVDVSELDDLAKQVDMPSILIPTPVGMCMYMRRDALNEIGLYDDNAFGRGYGEENDWSMRCLQRGWMHTAATNVYIGHAGTATFGSEKQKLLQNANQVLQLRWPTYFKGVEEYAKQSPLNYAKAKLDIARIGKIQNRTLIVTHRLGGGIEARLNTLTETLFKDALYLKYHQNSPNIAVFESSGTAYNFLPAIDTRVGVDGLVDIIQELGIGRISVQAFVGYEYNMPNWVMAVANVAKIPVEYYLHDYYMACPRIKMIGDNLERCNCKSADDCTSVIKKAGSIAGIVNVTEWREMYHRALLQADKIIAPSLDVKNTFLEFYPDLNITYIDHGDDLSLVPIASPYEANKPIKVAVFGDISVEKGARVLMECADYVRDNNIPLIFVVAGSCSLPLQGHPNITFLGAYERGKLFDVLKPHNCHISFFPACWKETYSHSLSEAFKACLFPVAFNIGAIAERIQRYNYGTILPYEERHNPEFIVKNLIETTKLHAGDMFNEKSNISNL